MPSHAFPKSHRILKRSDFQTLARKSSLFQGKAVVFSWKRTNRDLTRLGITVTKKYAKAFHRNRFKRLCREAFRQSTNKPAVGLDINVRPRLSFEKMTFREICEDFTQFFASFQS